MNAMIYSTKNKLLIGLLIMLLLANIASIAVFWLGRERRIPLLQPAPAAYLVKELGLDAAQQESFMVLVTEHRQNADSLRRAIAAAKDNFFKLLQQPGLPDTTKKGAAKNISRLTEQLDINTFDHFSKLRMLCTTAQQKKFDTVIQEVMHMIGGPGQGAAGRMGPPPPGRREDDPPPGDRQEGPPPPR
jgi:hypothetical protein